MKTQCYILAMLVSLCLLAGCGRTKEIGVAESSVAPADTTVTLPEPTEPESTAVSATTTTTVTTTVDPTTTTKPTTTTTTKRSTTTTKPTTTTTTKKPTTTTKKTTTTTKKPTTTISQEKRIEQYRQQVFAMVNTERQKEGLQPLTYSAALQPAVDIRAKEIVSTFEHTRPDGSRCFTAITELGISYFAAGENIAAGYPDPAAVMDGWMNSSGHRANILKGSFTQMAVGVHIENGRIYWVQMFIG